MTLATSCSSSAYLGRRTDDGTFVHIGYGLVLAPDPSEWLWLDPMKDASHEHAPSFSTLGLDLDANGELTLREQVPHYEPVAVFTSRTSTQAFVELVVEILPRSREEWPIPRLVERHRADGARSDVHPMLEDGVRAWVYGPSKSTNGMQRVIVRDQPAFASPEGVVRRQVVYLVLHAPAISPELRRAHDRMAFDLRLARDESAHASPDGVVDSGR